MNQKLLALLALCALLSGCATEYQPQNRWGGYSTRELGSNRYRVVFAGNGFTTQESAQTYWLYQCAELTLEKGFDGFRIIQSSDLARTNRNDPVIAVRNDGKADLKTFIIRAQINYPIDNSKPIMVGDIELLHKPFNWSRPRTYDAKVLKAELDKYVNGPKCDGNVCAHIHTYLYPNRQDSKN